MSVSLCQAASGGGWPSTLVVNRMEEVLHGGAESLSEWCFGSVGMTTPGKFEVNGGTWTQSTKISVLTLVVA